MEMVIRDFKIFILALVILVWFNRLNLSPIHFGKSVPIARGGDQTVISDTTFNNADWTAITVSEFGAAQTNHKEFSGGNPGSFRYMEHLLPAPPGLNDLAIVQVTHIYKPVTYNPAAEGAIDHIDYSEDFALLNLPWNQAFIASMIVIIQDGQTYRSSRSVNAIGATGWMSGSLTGLEEEDFIALDGSGNKPDFSAEGSEMQFGFWRTHSRGATQPPIPSNEILVYQHGIDNFSVTLHKTPPTNQLPVAEHDFFFYFDYFYGGRSTFPVLDNDSDPDGDPVRITSITEPNIGTITSFDDNSITYFVDPTVFPIFFPDIVGDGFTYYITDGQDSSGAVVYISFCACPIECLSPLTTESTNITGSLKINAGNDTLDIEVFRQFRDDILLSSKTGSHFVDLYYRNAQEVMPLFIFNRPDLGLQAARALLLLQDPLRNLIQGDGSEIISQDLVDSVSIFLDTFMEVVSDSLRDSLNIALTRLGQLQDLAGLSVSDAINKALGDSTSTAFRDNSQVVPADFNLYQNYPNPFNPTTKISWQSAVGKH